MWNSGNGRRFLGSALKSWKWRGGLDRNLEMAGDFEGFQTQRARRPRRIRRKTEDSRSGGLNKRQQRERRRGGRRRLMGAGEQSSARRNGGPYVVSRVHNSSVLFPFCGEVRIRRPDTGFRAVQENDTTCLFCVN